MVLKYIVVESEPLLTSFDSSSYLAYLFLELLDCGAFCNTYYYGIVPLILYKTNIVRKVHGRRYPAISSHTVQASTQIRYLVSVFLLGAYGTNKEISWVWMIFVIRTHSCSSENSSFAVFPHTESTGGKSLIFIKFTTFCKRFFIYSLKVESETTNK